MRTVLFFIACGNIVYLGKVERVGKGIDAVGDGIYII